MRPKLYMHDAPKRRDAHGEHKALKAGMRSIKRRPRAAAEAAADDAAEASV